MAQGAHLDIDLLLSVAEGEVEGTDAATDHLAGCPVCRAEVARLRSFVTAIGEELLESRPGCLSTDELATLAPGADADHPHLADCPLCREEWQALLALEARRALAAGEGAFVRPELFERGGRELYAGRGALEIEVEPGSARSGTLAGARVSLRVEGEALVVRIEGEPEKPLRLRLESDVVEKRIDLAPGETRLPRARWRRARVEPAAG